MAVTPAITFLSNYLVNYTHAISNIPIHPVMWQLLSLQIYA